MSLKSGLHIARFVDDNAVMASKRTGQSNAIGRRTEMKQLFSVLVDSICARVVV